MSIRELLGKELLLFDGGMGTMLQERGLLPGTPPDVWSVLRPDVVEDIHGAYLNAGADILTTNTFGCTARKLEGSGHAPADVAAAAVRCASAAIKKTGKGRFVAFDVGPTGKLLAPLGDLGFEEAVALFSEAIAAGAAAGADLVLIETMSDTYELKAAVLAAKESTGLPVCATVALDQRGKLLTGGDISSVVALLEGLRVDALGLNCGLGPKEMLPMLKTLRALTSLPIIITPNAGLPREENGETIYDVGPEEFAALMKEALRLGAHLLGGCCGTTPAHIAAMKNACNGMPLLPVMEKEHSVVSSFSRTVCFDGRTRLIGERINPTGKAKLKAALREENYDYALREAIAQQDAGADILDVNAGLPDIDEAAVLSALTARIQGVTDLPLQLDSASPKALEAAMRLYNGKPMINSVNGKEENMRAVFPLVQKYGGFVVALTLDENGIPETPEGRLKIAERIISRAREYGIRKKDIIVDALTMAVSAGGENAAVTLATLRLIKATLGVHTVLGVSNVSFGLPHRERLNAAFFTMAMHAGLDAAIINPHSAHMRDACYSAEAILGRDFQCARYIEYCRENEEAAVQPEAQPEDMTLYEAVRRGLKKEAGEGAKRALAHDEPIAIIDAQLVPALNEVGQGFEKGTVFLPQLLMSADAAKAAFDVIKGRLGAGKGTFKGTVVVATVQGDVHDIGKNIVKALLENYRFKVIDLGKDVPPEAVLEAAGKSGTKLVGLSALMTTTVDSMRKTIALLKKELPGCRIMVGGAVLTKDYAKRIGADFYATDAMASVHYAQEVYSK